MKMDVIVIGHDEARALLPMRECIEAMIPALKAYSSGNTIVPLRSILWLPDKAGGLGLMPGYLGAPATLGLKVVTVFPKNEGTQYESHQGAVMLFDADNGRLLTVIDGCEITTIRTAAASAVATRELAREDADTLAILGTGTQARSHLEAMSCVRPIRRVFVWGRSREKADAFARGESRYGNVDIKAVDTVQEAMREADIICTVTGTREPILKGEWIAAGAHINAVGACIPAARELDNEAMRRSMLYVDSRESALNEAGDFIIALKEGAIDEDHIRGELGELLLGDISGRSEENDITLFKSLGLAIEDLASANHIYRKAIEGQRGTSVTVGGLRHEAD